MRCLVFLVVLFSCISSQAATITVNPTTDRWAYLFGMTFVLTAEGNDPLNIQHFPSGEEYRSAMEFSLSGVPAAQQIDSANLRLYVETAAPFGSDPELSVYGYSGNGTLTVSDFVDTSNLLTALPTVPILQYINLDVTAFIQSLYSSSATFAGFNLIAPTLGDQVRINSKENANPLLRPELTINYSEFNAEVIPEPSSIILFGLGAVGMAFSRSRGRRGAKRCA